LKNASISAAGLVALTGLAGRLRLFACRLGAGRLWFAPAVGLQVAQHIARGRRDDRVLGQLAEVASLADELLDIFGADDTFHWNGL
jgi:hypothetical protein